MRFSRLVTTSIVVSSFLILMGLSSSVAAQTAVGAIGGTVTDASGGVMPGATVTLTNTQGAVGGNQTAITNERGTYQFSQLIPGTYTVKADLQGFRPAEARNIVVNADMTARADVKLEIGALSEGVTVTGQAPLLDTTTATKQTVLTREQLEDLPNRTDVWSVAKMVPGVILSKVDVGGSEGFLQSSMTVRGSSGQNKFTIDGMDVSSLDGTATIATMYLDPASFQESNMVMGAGSAENSAGGLTVNMVTRTGTNQLHGAFGVPGWTGGRLARSSNYSDKVKADLLSGVPPRAIAANPNIDPSADIDYMSDLSASLSGPVIKDKLWYSGTWHDQRLYQYKLGAYNPDGTQVLDDNILWNTTAKVSYQLTRTAQISYFNNLQYKLIGHRGGSTFGDGRARTYNDKYPNVNQLKYTSPIGTRVVADITYNRFRADDVFGSRPEVKPGDISKNDLTTQTITDALPTYDANAMFRDQVKMNGSFFARGHDLRFGFELLKGGEKSRVWSTSGMQARYRAGIPDSVTTYLVRVTAAETTYGSDIPVLFERWARDTGTFIQDRWTVNRRLVLNLGFRYETNVSWMPGACRPDTQFAAGGCYPEVDYAPRFKDVAPRFNMVYDLNGDGKTALKFSANRYNSPINITIVNQLNSLSTVSNQRVWLPQSSCATAGNVGCDLNGDLVPQMNELGPNPGYNIPAVAANPYDAKLKRPVSYEYVAEFQRQLPKQVVLSVAYSKKLYRRNTGTRNDGIPTSAYSEVTVTEKVTGQQVQVFLRDPAYNTAATRTVIFNTELANSHYDGVDVTANKRMSNRFSLSGGGSFGRTFSYGGGGDLNNPFANRKFEKGVVTNSRPWSYRMSGVYQAPYQWILSATVQYDKGAGELTTVLVDNQTITFNAGQGTTQTVDVAKREQYFPDLFQTDMSLRRTFRFGGKSFVPRVDMFNLTNGSTIIARTTQLGGTYHRISNIQRGRMIKLGFQYEF